MSTEENKAVIRRIIEEAFNKGNLAVADEAIAPNYVYHGAGGQEFKGVEGFKQFVTMMRSAFPDVRMTPEDMVAEGDKVAHCSRLRGTFKGEMMGMAPTGKQIDISVLTLSRFAGGKEVEAWLYADTLAMYQQMGVAPAAG
jgi:predicted ester cyclase